MLYIKHEFDVRRVSQLLPVTCYLLPVCMDFSLEYIRGVACDRIMAEKRESDCVWNNCRKEKKTGDNRMF